MITFLFLTTVLLLFVWGDSRKPKGFPPGPNWLPIVGCIPLIRRLHEVHSFYHLVWQYFANHYGPVVGFRIGRGNLIVVSGHEAIKEVYSRDEFNGRPKGFFFRVRTMDKRQGVVFTDGKDWEALKRFSLRTMKQLGTTGHHGVVGHVEKEASEMVEHFRIKAQAAEAIDMSHAFDIPVLNVMWLLLAGFRYRADDNKLVAILKLIHQSFRVIDMSGGILNQFPFIRHIFPGKSGYRKIIQTHMPIWKFLVETIAEIQNNMTPDTPPKSIIEAFLVEVEKNGPRHTIYNAEQLLSICLDFFQAGSETTSNTLGFGVIYMLHYPEVLKKMRKELDSVVGASRAPLLADRFWLPYTEAVICEVQRLSNVAPLAIAHRTRTASKLHDYVVPQDCIVLLSIHSLNMDRAYWKDPEIFRPERFLAEDGSLIHHDIFMPFGLGKRRCLGEHLARTSLFLFFSTFFHKFDVAVPDGESLPDMRGIDGITLSPKPYNVCLRIRNQ